MQIRENYDLTHLNTFGIQAHARFFTKIETELDLKELLASSEFKNNKKLFLGGGSNILITRDFEGIVVLNKLKGIEILEDTEDSVLIRSMSGEVWHDLVLFTVSRGYWGVENLSLIPGTVGAAPMQNIGAYGAELASTLETVEAFEIATGKKKVFKNNECELGYRDSIFKNKLKDKYFISATTLKLSKLPKPNTSYKILSDYLGKNKIKIDHPKNISDAVGAIRKSKLPDPKEIGNAGSFFKNVLLNEEDFQKLLKVYPDVPHFKEEGMVKIPAGWLIEQCGLKGYRIGKVGVHERQALVLVNYGGASGKELQHLAEHVASSVFSKFEITLIPEVNFI